MLFDNEKKKGREQRVIPLKIGSTGERQHEKFIIQPLANMKVKVGQAKRAMEVGQQGYSGGGSTTSGKRGKTPNYWRGGRKLIKTRARKIKGKVEGGGGEGETMGNVGFNSLLEGDGLRAEKGGRGDGIRNRICLPWTRGRSVGQGW